MARDDFRNDRYDPNEVYSGGAKDHQGHSTNIRCHIPDPWTAAIAEVINSPDWPEYRTPQDFYRDAIYHRMKWASRQESRSGSERVRTLMALIQGQAALDYATLIREASHSFIENARKTLSQLLGDGNILGVRETIKELEASLDDLGEPYRSSLRTEIESWERRANTL